MNVGVPELLVIGLMLIPLVVVVAVVVLAVASSRRAVSPPSGPAGSYGGLWYADPTGRFAQRWWNGAEWTADVVLPNGQVTVDPAGRPDHPPPSPR